MKRRKICQLDLLISLFFLEKMRVDRRKFLILRLKFELPNKFLKTRILAIRDLNFSDLAALFLYILQVSQSNWNEGLLITFFWNYFLSFSWHNGHKRVRRFELFFLFEFFPTRRELSFADDNCNRNQNPFSAALYLMHTYAMLKNLKKKDEKKSYPENDPRW